MKLSVVIVSYNVCQLLEDCLRSVKKNLEGIEGEVYVVDNASSDHTVERLQPTRWFMKARCGAPSTSWTVIQRRVGQGCVC